MKKVAVAGCVSIVLTVLGFLSGCSKNDSVSPVEMKSHSDRQFGFIPINQEKSLRIVNRFGGVMVNGYFQDGIDTYLFKTVLSTDASSAQAALNAIQLIQNTDGDTLNAAVRLHDPKGGADYTCWVMLDVPDSLDCALDSSYQKILISDMSGLVEIRNAEAGVEITRHSGNLRIATRQGNVVIEAALPDSGFCRVRTGSGNIIVRIPQSTSATVRAHANGGAVRYSNLNLTGVIQKADSLSGTLAEGQGEIILDSLKGNIELIGS